MPNNDFTPTVSLRKDTVHTATQGCFQTHEPVFAMPKHGNKVVALTTGQETFESLAEAISSAKRFILFTDWQMDYDVELTARGSSNYQGRFTELLAKKVAEGVEIKALLYDSVEAAVYTHENHVRDRLMGLNPKVDELGKAGAPARNPAGNLPVEVALQKPATGRAVENILFSHHQKTVVIDGTVAFIGGIDVTYGRWCDNNFDVVADPVKHRINDLYNPNISAGRLMTADEKRLTEDWAGEQPPASFFGAPRPGFSRPYYIIGILSQRIKDILERGYTIDQVEDLIQLMQIDEQIRDYLAQKAREIRALLDAISRTLNRYADAKAAAGKKLIAGNLREGVADSIAADIQLLKVAFRKISQAADAVSTALSDYVGSKINDFSDWFDRSMVDLKGDLARFEEYRRNPNLMVSDVKRLIDDIIGLRSQLIDDFVLEEGCQPRMPWQDVHCRVEGPAVHDIFANFVQRWNVAVLENKDNTSRGVDRKTGIDWMVRPLSTDWLKRWGSTSTVFGDISKHGTAGGVSVQIVRSMAHQLLQLESKHASKLPLPLLRGATAKSSPSANNTVPGEKQMDGVLEAMIHAVRASKAYIYIETQFFISNCGKSDNYEEPIAQNPLIDELANRIGLAIQTGSPFHVYVVLPVHPEGNLLSGGVAKQLYWAHQTIKRGRKSLIRQVCETIVRKRKKLKPGDNPSEEDVKALVNGGAWQAHLTFLNLRNWGVTALFPRDKLTNKRLDDQMPKGQFVITEQVYVHSKLMIVDDAVAIIGSANCNDRSLQGNGDTEIAAVIVDNDVKQMDIGTGIPTITRKFARELRVALWEKHLGLRIEGDDYTKGDRPIGPDNAAKPIHPGERLHHPPRQRSASASGAAGINLALPASPKTWQAIQTIARNNAAVYESVFQHTPRNSMKYFRDTETGWPKRLSRSVLLMRALSPHTKDRVHQMVQKQIDAKAKQDVLITDYSTLPPQLTSNYMVDPVPRQSAPYRDANVREPGKVHRANHVARNVLGAQLVGFWVEMPLDFGSQERDSWLKGRVGDAAVAIDTTPRRSATPMLASKDLPTEKMS